jgi:hypothetical protein
MDDVPYDWADDDSISAEETMRRFKALNPEPTSGPVVRNFEISFVSGTGLVERPRTVGPLEPDPREDMTSPKLAADPRQPRLLRDKSLTAT